MKRLFVIALLCVGCAAQQPHIICPCQESTRDYAVTGFVVVSNASSSALEYLEKTASFLRNKIEEWKINHPEWVETANQKLAELEEKINYVRTRMAK